MAGQQATPRAMWRDTVFSRTAPGVVGADGGSAGYGATELGSGANQYVCLPFVFARNIVLEGWAVQAKTWCTGGTAINLSIAKTPYKTAVPTGALTAANRVTQAIDVRAAVAPPFLEDATKIAHGMYDALVHPVTGNTLNNNIIARGEKLYLYMDAAAATALENLFVTLWFSTLVK